MQEAEKKPAELVDIETEDFIRFCQFAYTSDYFPPEPRVELSNNLAEDEPGYGSQDEELDLLREEGNETLNA